jgi:hypothetical protein
MNFISQQNARVSLQEDAFYKHAQVLHAMQMAGTAALLHQYTA